MAPRLFEKCKSKIKSRRRKLPSNSTSVHPPTPPPTTSNLAVQPATRSTSQPSPSHLASIDSEVPLAGLQERLWDQAYNELKAAERPVVDAYERILSTELGRHNLTSDATESTEHDISQTQELTCRQMQQLVRAGLERTWKEASIKQGIEEGLKIISVVKGMVDKAIKAAPQAAVAWAGVCLALEILSKPATEAGINRQGIVYVLSRMDWYWKLALLLLDENRAEKSTAALRDELKKSIIQLYQKLLLYQINSVCLYYRNQAKIILRDLFQLDNWQGQLDEIKDAEDIVKGDCEQYCTLKTQLQLRDLTATANSLERELQNLGSDIQEQTQRQEKRHRNDKDEECLKDLSETDPRYDKKRIQEFKGGLLRDSYCWILGDPDFQRFRDNPENRLLWIKGDPGKGKTMLLCGIIDELERERSSYLSYFFCQSAYAQLSNATAVLRGLIYLLIDRQRSLISHVRRGYGRAGKRLFEDRNAWQALSEIFTAILNDSTLVGDTLIVDALDECTTDRERLLDFIINSPPRIKWIVSSRNWVNIQEKLDNVKQKVRLHLELNEDSISKAVDTYIAYKVNKLAHDKNYDEGIRTKVHRHLTHNAGGTFLWVALVCKQLADSTIRKRHIKAELESWFPPGLDSLYKRMMEQVCDSNDANICKEILAIASVVYRPVTVEELRILVRLPEEYDDYDDLKEIIGSCGSFLTLRKSVVHFVHPSAKEYLLDKRFEQTFPPDIEHQHRMVFSRSLDALSRSLQRDIYSLRDPGFPIYQVTPLDPDPLVSNRYSCIFWVNHLIDSYPAAKMRDMRDETLQDCITVHNFLKKKYLYWLESLSLLCSMSEGVIAVEKLMELARKTEARQLTVLLQDAFRFIHSHKQAIEVAPLQVYTSALVFSPTHSLIRELFKKEEPSWIALKPSMEMNWNDCLQTLQEHEKSIWSVVFSADGQWLASGSSDKTVRIWNPHSGAHLQIFSGHSNFVTSVAFSPDGKHLASGSYDNTVKVWDIATGACQQTFKGHVGLVYSVAFSSDGKQLASGSSDKTVKIWDLHSGTPPQTFSGHSDRVYSVAFSPDGQYLASGSHDKTIKIWNRAMRIGPETLNHDNWVYSVVFSPDGQYLASGSRDTSIKIWDVARSVCLQTLNHNDWVRSVVFSADGKRLASGSHDKTIKIWDVATGACLYTLQGHDNKVLSVAFLPDGQRLASGSSDKTIKIWYIPEDSYLQTLNDHSDFVCSVVFSVDSKWLASGSYDKTIKIWDAAKGICLQTLEGHNDKVGSVVFSADSQHLASGSYDKTIKIWDIATGACSQTLKGHEDSVYSTIFSTDGQKLASGSSDNSIKTWGTITGTCLQTFKGHNALVQSIVFSVDSKWLASGSRDKTVKIWDTASGACLRTLKGDGGWVASIAFSADGQQLVSSSTDNTVKIWDAATGVCSHTFEVGRKLTYISFTSTTNCCLCTNIGLLNLDLLPVGNTQLTKAALRSASHSGYGISSDKIWIVKDGKNMLWLPPEYRDYASAVAKSTVAIGCQSGRVLVMSFS